MSTTTSVCGAKKDALNRISQNYFTVQSLWRNMIHTYSVELIPVAARSEAWVCGRSLAGIKGSNPAEGMDVCLLWVLCVVCCKVHVSATGRSLVQRIPIGCVRACVCLSLREIGWYNNPLHKRQVGRRGHTKEERGQAKYCNVTMRGFRA